MSNQLAISAVTAVLQYYLNQTYSAATTEFSTPVKVTCVAPDQVQQGLGGAADVENQVNLFLHQVTRNAARRNDDLASMSADGKTRLRNPPLALNLHYLLTAYGSEEWQAEALLGYALMMLHEAPVFTREDIATALAALDPTPPTPPPYPTNPLRKLLKNSGLADQIEMIKVTPENLGREEMAWLWTALKADYRPTYPFEVSMVLMQPSLSTTPPLPVLTTSVNVLAQAAAEIAGFQLPKNQTATQASDPVMLTGSSLTGSSQILLFNARFAVEMIVTGLTVADTSVGFQMPANPQVNPPPVGDILYPAGIYDISAQFLDVTKKFVTGSSNKLQLPVAPVLPPQVAGSAVTAEGSQVTVSFSPPAWEGQTVSLSLNTLSAPFLDVSATTPPFTGQKDTLTFQFDQVLPAATPMLGRLTVDGVSSQVTLSTTTPPTFTGPMVTL